MQLCPTTLDKETPRGDQGSQTDRGANVRVEFLNS